MALQNDPTILEADVNRRAAMESKPQAISQLLPQLAANGVVQQERDKGTSNLVETAQVSGENVSEAFPFDRRVATSEHHYGIGSADIISLALWAARLRNNVDRCSDRRSIVQILHVGVAQGNAAARALGRVAAASAMNIDFTAQAGMLRRHPTGL
jgi:hypothetical protein